MVLDGTGTDGIAVDVAVDGDRIVRLSPWGEPANAPKVIDATDRTVTPGFVDPHTHKDAQLFWDPSGSPSVLHGVTSVILGSCGIGVAPLSPDLHEYALRSLESVEEIHTAQS